MANAPRIKVEDRIISIQISRNSVTVTHRHCIDDVANMVAALAEHFEEDEDLAIILECALNLYRKNTSTKTR